MQEFEKQRKYMLRAIELAKNYSDDDVRKIINAVLDKVNKEN